MSDDNTQGRRLAGVSAWRNAVRSKNPHEDRDRGFTLTVYLIFLFLLNVMGFITALSDLFALQASKDSAGTGNVIIFLVQIVINIGAIASIAALWQFKRFGYYGIMVSYSILLIISLLNANWLLLILTLVLMTILYNLVQAIQLQLE